jgi:hypothetical protein
MDVLYPPGPIQPTPEYQVFLAGSIEMGTAEDWQTRVQQLLEPYEGIIYNPRRSDYDPTWEQRIDNPNFFGQVDWELNALDAADLIFMYFDPKTKSPISLLELGLHARSGKLLVMCPDGFWRKGNVDIVCERYNIPQINTLDELIERVEFDLQLDMYD